MRDLKSIAFALLFALLSQMLRGEDPRDAGAFWSLQVKKVHRGMKQSLVTELLSPRSEGEMDFAKDGKSYSITYALDQHWSVTIVFDRSGWHEENNPYSVMGFPNDKVIRPPRLQRQENLIDETLFPATPPKVR